MMCNPPVISLSVSWSEQSVMLMVYIRQQVAPGFLKLWPTRWYSGLFVHVGMKYGIILIKIE